MRYYATASGPSVREAMRAGQLGQIITPASGNRLIDDAYWCADNAAFAGRYPGDDRYLAWLSARATHARRCAFATAPDVVFDAAATLARSLPMLERIRAAGYPVALVAQDGLEHLSIPFDSLDVLFLGGSTAWKLGPAAADLAAQARARGLRVHCGRVVWALSLCLVRGSGGLCPAVLRVARRCVVSLPCVAVKLIFFSSAGWETWGLEHPPLIPESMPVLVDDDLRLTDGAAPRPAAVANRWLRELPASGAPAASTWEAYARALKAWMEFVAERGVAVFDDRERLRAVLSAYAQYRFAGPLEARFAPATWNLHIGVVAAFYRWAAAEGHAAAEPFSYATARRIVQDMLRGTARNLAKVRAPKRHVTIKHLEPDFARLFVRALEGLDPDGCPDPTFRGRDPGRNTAMARLVLASGLRRREFTHLLVHEVPPLPAAPTVVPVPLPVAAAIAKGRKQRSTWISYDALAAVHRYIGLERALTAEGSPWQPDPAAGEPLVVRDADWHGGTINGRRMAWSRLGPAERLRLVDPGGGSLLLALRGDGGPFLDWATVFRRAANRIRARFEPRFPHVHPHRLRHSFAMATLEHLVAGYYRQAAALVADTGDNPAMALYLTKSDPLMVLRDLLGHSSVTTTELYLRRLDTARVFRDAYEQAGRHAGIDPAVLAEVDAEFLDDLDLGEAR